MNINAVHMTH